MSRQERCDTCKFSELVQAPNVVALQCRRYPPNVVAIPRQVQGGMQINMQAVLPTMQGAEWCGEWAAGVKIETTIPAFKERNGQTVLH